MKEQDLFFATSISSCTVNNIISRYSVRPLYLSSRECVDGCLHSRKIPLSECVPGEYIASDALDVFRGGARAVARVCALRRRRSTRRYLLAVLSVGHIHVDAWPESRALKRCSAVVACLLNGIH